MVRPPGAPKPQARSRCPHHPENRENLTSLTSDILDLRLQALNLHITGSKAQLGKCQQNAFQPMQRPLAKGRKLAGCVQQGKGKTRVAWRAIAQPDPVAEVTDNSSSVSLEDNFEGP